MEIAAASDDRRALIRLLFALTPVAAAAVIDVVPPCGATSWSASLPPRPSERLGIPLARVNKSSIDNINLQRNWPPLPWRLATFFSSFLF